MSSYKCVLPPFKRTEVLSMQEAKQNAGWNITAFNLPEAWKVSQGDGVKIAVLDTGADLSHQDLVENLLPGYNFISNNEHPMDDNSHGSHCIGTICASNNDIGIVGVAPKAKVMPVKVLDNNGTGDFATVAKGIKWAVDNGANLISMSLGCPKPIQQVAKAISYAASKGVVTFCAAGNSGPNTPIFYPANYPFTISIGAIDEHFNRAKFSNAGDNLDFMCPGVNILSTVPNNWYAMMSGTSMATPFAVGVAALLMSFYIKEQKTINSVEAFRSIFKENTVPIHNPEFAGKKFFEGFGIIDPLKLMEWVKNKG